MLYETRGTDYVHCSFERFARFIIARENLLFGQEWKFKVGHSRVELVNEFLKKFASENPPLYAISVFSRTNIKAAH